MMVRLSLILAVASLIQAAKAVTSSVRLNQQLIDGTEKLGLTDAPDRRIALSIISVNSSTRWELCQPCQCHGQMQIVDIAIKNDDSIEWITQAAHLTVEIISDGIKTVKRGHVKRLMPGDTAFVEVGVQNQPGITKGENGPAVATARWSPKQQISLLFNATYGIPDYDMTAISVNTHESPNWFRNAKFGIFVHWGIYSVPAYGGLGKDENYAEWYWSSQMSPNDRTRTYQWHLDHYGPDVVYDDFIANFTAEAFDPKEWVDLFAEAGAKYFVPTTKHHEGLALFDMPATVSNRTSVKLGPKRDLLKELFDAAKKFHPQLKRGTYFSLPEFFNPAFRYEYTVYHGSFKVGPPKNPYTNEPVPYTGFVEVEDFLDDIQLPQMNILAYQYDTDIMWCDISNTSSHSDKFAGKWLNHAQKSNRQVSLNQRCGYSSTGHIIGDFLTPEYEPVNKFRPRHWEACRGLDPHSFGYNKVTPDEAYLNATSVVQTLVDITAKNGNFLLDIGPKADGTIPDVMQKALRETGEWLKTHGESIYNTKYWPYIQGQGDFRYVTDAQAFYIHCLSEPPLTIVLPNKVPYIPGDEITVLGGELHGTAVPSHVNKDGYLVLELTAELVRADRHTWTFKIEF